jgi:hypothetical protein
MVMRSCRRCHKSFQPKTPTQCYCGEDCQQAALARECLQCHGIFYAATEKQYRKYCKAECKAEAGGQERIAAAAQARTERGRVLVACAWEHCPQPDEPISIVRSKSEGRHFHDECRKQWREAGGARKGTGKGKELFCKGCGESKGYCGPSRLHEDFCYDCRRRKPEIVQGSVTRICAAPGCEKLVTVSAARAALYKRSFCRKHGHGWQRRQGFTVTCVTCRGKRHYAPSRVPLSVDKATMTWTCPGCRTYGTTTQTRECAYCHRDFPARITLSVMEEARPRFCRWSHRQKYYDDLRRRCRYCERRITRKGQGHKYCDRTCYTAAVTGQPKPDRRTFAAELRIRDAYEQAGIRGIRALARASNTSVNTVRKFLQAGRIG